MGRRLVANVALRNPKSGLVEIFTPESDMPTWVEKEISNPAVWEDDGAAETEPESKIPTRRQGVTKWAEYAAANDVDVPEGADKDAIIVALEQAGVPTQ